MSVTLLFLYRKAVILLVNFTKKAPCSKALHDKNISAVYDITYDVVIMKVFNRCRYGMKTKIYSRKVNMNLKKLFRKFAIILKLLHKYVKDFGVNFSINFFVQQLEMAAYLSVS